MKTQFLQKTLQTAFSIGKSSPTKSMSSSTLPTTTKGYVFGLRANEQAVMPSATPPLGRTIANWKISNASYTENMQDFDSAFVYEFPTLNDAVQWKKDFDALEENQGPMVVTESQPFDESFGGYSIFFIKVDDKAKFTAYNPNESLEKYRTQRLKVPLKQDTTVASPSTKEKFDAAVLIAFDTAEIGKEWLESDEYLKPHGELRLATTSGHGVVISAAENVGAEEENQPQWAI